MDVSCSRCQTEYELDDALVSGRGTSVKCTNCGHQFRVHPESQSPAGVEQWVVKKADGSTLKLRALADLQRAIQSREVGRADEISRDNQNFRPISSIAELIPFFNAVDASLAPPSSRGGVARTLIGITPEGQSTFPPAGARQARRSRASHTSPISEPPPPLAANEPTAPVAPPAAAELERAASLVPKFTGDSPDVSSPAEPREHAISGDDVDGDLPTVPINDVPPIPAPNRRESAFARPYASQAAPNPQHEPAVVIRSSTPPPAGVMPVFRPSFDSHSDLLSQVSEPRTVRSRWIFALVALAGSGLLLGTVGQKYLRQYVAAPAVATSASDVDRVPLMLRNGEQFFYAGDLEASKEEFDKASVLAENDAKVVALLARLEAARTDQVWLKLRIVDPADTSQLAALKQEWTLRLKKLEQAVTRALRVAPTDAAVIRAQVDALRLSDQLAQARVLVPRLGASASDVETEYVRAGLDLAESAPSWAGVIDRLRTVISIEHGLGRARSALVYALILAERYPEAQLELEKLKTEPAASSLVPLLEDFAIRQAGALWPTNGKTTDETPPDTSAAEASSAAAGAAAASAAAPAANEAPAHASDPRRMLERAGRARNSGDLALAKQLYQQVLSHNPADFEALTNLGELAKQNGDLTAAMGYFEAVERLNPYYLPALIGIADVKWAYGAKDQAVNIYRRVLERAGAGSSYGARAQTRIADYEAQAAAARNKPEAPAKPNEPAPNSEPTPNSEPAPKQEPAPSEAPAIDTSDLPELSQ